MTLYQAILLFSIMLLLAAVPGASVMVVVANSISKGFKSGVSTAIGIIAGDATFILLAVAGMSLIAESLGALFFIIKCMAAAYLIWFIITVFKNKL